MWRPRAHIAGLTIGQDLSERVSTPGCTLVSGIEGLGQIETKFVA
jgi:hypothetical protein